VKQLKDAGALTIAASSTGGHDVAARQRYRILFFLYAENFDRVFECALRALLEAGHRVHVAFERDLGQWSMFDSLADEYRDLSHGPAPERKDEHWAGLAQRLRFGIDCLRYLEKDYANASALRARGEERLPRGVRMLAALPLLRTTPGRRFLSWLLRACERSIPLDSEVERFITTFRPDIVFVSPLVSLGSSQPDYVLAARRCGIHSALLVASWDNLTNKGIVNLAPDLTVVWNEQQRVEAARFHRIRRDRVAVVGAHAYDHWFDWHAKTTREEFCNRLGFDPANHILLYVASSSFIAGGREPSFVERWLQGLRSEADGVLRAANVLIRPHPQNFRSWLTADLSRYKPVEIWPRAGASPTDEGSKEDYFDSIYHASAVVGLNTSALIESAIVGRPVFTVCVDEFRSTQEGTLHFSHLAGDGDGVLCVARSFDEHQTQLRSALSSPGTHNQRLTEFVAGFVRPQGLERPAALALVTQLENLASLPSPKPARQSWHVIMRPLLLAFDRLGWLDPPFRPGADAGRRVIVFAAKERKQVHELHDAGYDVTLALPRAGAQARIGNRELRGSYIVAGPIRRGTQIAYFRLVKSRTAADLSKHLHTIADRMKTGKQQSNLRDFFCFLLRALADAAPVKQRFVTALRGLDPQVMILVQPLPVVLQEELMCAAAQLGINVARSRAESLTPEKVEAMLALPPRRPMPTLVRLILGAVLSLAVQLSRLRRAIRLRTRLQALLSSAGASSAP
jgi:hypothetical protein